MPQPVYFTVTADYKAFVEDADTDSDYTPEQVPVSATVTFTPLVNTGDVVRALGASPRPVGYIPAPVTAIIDTADGRLKLRTTADSGGAGDFAPVRLLGTSDLLELDGPLFYSVSFSNVVYANDRRGTIAGFTFEAPATDTEVNLISVGRAAGQAASNLVRPTVAVGTTTTGDPGTDAEVTNSGTSTSAVFDFTIPRGDQGEAATVTVGTVSTGNAGSSATVTNSGTSGAAVLNFTIPQGVAGSATINGITATELGRLVCTTATGGSGTEDGANTWAKLATWSYATSANHDMHVLLAVLQNGSASADAAIISVFVRFGTTGNAPIVAVEMLSKAGTSVAIRPDAFKIVSGGFGTPVELWMRKGATFRAYSVYELARTTSYSAVASSLTYHTSAPWQSATPTGAVNNVSTNGVTAFGVPVLTTTGSQSLSNKTISGASNTVTNLPSSATPDAARLVCTTAGGGSTAENGANTWAKIATFTTGTTEYASGSFIFAVTNAISTVHDTAIVSVFCSSTATNGNPVVSIDMLAKGGTGMHLPADSFKIISGGWNTNAELWMRKNANYDQFSVYEISRRLFNNFTVTYNNNAAWQSAVPTGAVNNVSSNGVTAFGIPVVTTTDTQALSNKTWTSAAVPATATSTGTVGQIAYDSNYVYICTATNTWRRAALATW